jgi:hypothetical protein
MIPENPVYKITLLTHTRTDYADYTIGLTHFDRTRWDAFWRQFQSRSRRLTAGDDLFRFDIDPVAIRSVEENAALNRFLRKCAPYIGPVPMPAAQDGAHGTIYYSVPLDRNNWAEQYKALTIILPRLIQWVNLYPNFEVSTDRPFKRETFNLILGLGNPFSRRAQRELANKARNVLATTVASTPSEPQAAPYGDDCEDGDYDSF